MDALQRVNGLGEALPEARRSLVSVFGGESVVAGEALDGGDDHVQAGRGIVGGLYNFFAQAAKIKN